MFFRKCILLFSLVITFYVHGQQIGDFISITPGLQTTDFIFPSNTHKFQRVIEHGDAIVNGNMMDNFDFTPFISLAGSSTNGYLSINHELTPGGVTAMDLSFNVSSKLWEYSNATSINFNNLVNVVRPCSGGLTSYGTVVSGEETLVTTDANNDGYNDNGWFVESNPAMKTAIQKLWAMGCGQKENIVFHSNHRTAYFGNDANPGFLFKFIANTADDYTSGTLYAYQGSKNGNGAWILIPNTTQADRNNTMTICSNAAATIFNGIEDVEIGPDGKVYLAVKNENAVFRFVDSDPITGIAVSNFETFVGNMSYNITHVNGSSLTPWGTGNDNLAFDGQGNLWVLQDGSNNSIWVVGPDHTQMAPNVRMFGIAPAGSEPTGITFTPDYKFLFLSFQHPNSSNNVTHQTDAAGNPVYFDKDIAIVIALNADLGCPQYTQTCNDGDPETFNDVYNGMCQCVGTPIQVTLNKQVSGGADDAEEFVSTQVVNLSSSDLEMITDGTSQIVGIRFSNVNIPNGIEIISAKIQFTVDEISTTPTNLIFAGEKSTASLPFSATNGNISSRMLSQQNINWSNIPNWNTVGQAGPDQLTPELSTIVQELVQQTGWSSSSALTFVIQGTGNRVAVAWELAPVQAPKLMITYRYQNINNIGIGTPAPNAKLQVKDGNIYLESLGSGVILKSPNGDCWKLTITNTGIINSIAIPCP